MAFEPPEPSKTDGKFADMLKEIWDRMSTSAGAASSSGVLSPEARHERAARDRRVTEALVAEVATFRRVETTWQELKRWVQSEGVSMKNLAPSTVEAFILASVAPARAEAAMNWMRRNLNLLFEVPRFKKRTPNPVGEGAHQARVAPPFIMHALDEKLSGAIEANSHTAKPLLATWCVAWGSMRLIHVQRSRMLSMTDSTISMWCDRGKQRHLRHGFVWTVPRRTWGGTDIGTYMEPWASKPDVTGSYGLARLEDQKIRNASVVQVVRDELASFTESCEQLTSYSFRRVGPTLALPLGMSEHEMAALGQWAVTRTLVAPTAIRYAGSRAATAIRSRTKVYEMARLIANAGATAWQVPPFWTREFTDAQMAAADAVADLAAAEHESQQQTIKPTKLRAKLISLQQKKAAETVIKKATAKRDIATMVPAAKGRPPGSSSKIFSRDKSSIFVGGIDDVPFFKEGLIISCTKARLKEHAQSPIKVLPVTPEDDRRRDQQLKAAHVAVRQALKDNVNILIQCRRGRHRAPTIACILLCQLMPCDFAEAVDVVSARRPIAELSKALDRPHRGNPPLRSWAMRMAQEIKNIDEGKTFSWRATAARIHQVVDTDSHWTSCGLVLQGGEAGATMAGALAMAKNNRTLCNSCWRKIDDSHRAEWLDKSRAEEMEK